MRYNKLPRAKQAMVSDAIAAYVARDARSARDVIRRDDEVDLNAVTAIARISIASPDRILSWSRRHARAAERHDRAKSHAGAIGYVHQHIYVDAGAHRNRDGHCHRDAHAHSDAYSHSALPGLSRRVRAEQQMRRR